MPDPVPIIHIELPDWKWAVTTVIAVWAAFLSTRRAWLDWLEQRARIRASFVTTMRTFGGGEPPADFVSVNVANHGFLNVTFSQTCGSIQIKGKKDRYLLWQPLTDVTTWPHTLEPGQSFFVGGKKDALVRELKNAGIKRPVKMRGIACDAINRLFKSKWVVFKDHLA